MFKEFLEDGKSFISFIKRNTFWMLQVTIALIFIGLTTQLLNVVFSIVLIEGLALGLSEVAQYVYTKLNFRESNTINLGYIFLGVHLLAALVFFGIYFVQFNGVQAPVPVSIMP